ncbi:hypothetical protein [Candidatus Uabimicrobium sp. HlEnr_7]|uniref:hypothetical protein n=1 Tax=Candidatus Uabimicrobium helgolandensis TaxID=3095367 RepID=UPI003556CE99
MSGSSLYLSVFLVGFLCFAVSMVQWRLSMYFFFAWLLVEGAFRKWFLPGLATPLIFVKYAMIIGPFIRCLIKNKISYNFPFIPMIIVYAFWGLIEFSNWRATSDIRIFLIGAMIHFSFISLIIIIPRLLDTREKIWNFFRWGAILSIPILLLGMYQYSLPQGHFLNKYVGDDSNIASVLGKARITSTFSYIGPFGQYLTILFGFLMILIMQEKNKILSTVYYGCFLAAWLNTFMTASRGVVIISFIYVLGFIVLSRSRENILWRKFVVRLFVAGMLTIAMFMFTQIGQDSSQRLLERFSRGNQKGEIAYRIYKMVRVAKLQNAGLVGYGIGTEFQGIKRILDIRRKFGISFEGEKDRLVAGIGLVGYIIVIIMRVVIFFWIWKVFLRIRDQSLRLILVFSVICLTQGFLLGGVIYNFLASVQYWFSLGLAVSILQIESRERLLYQKRRLNFCYDAR